MHAAQFGFKNALQRAFCIHSDKILRGRFIIACHPFLHDLPPQDSCNTPPSNHTPSYSEKDKRTGKVLQVLENLLPHAALPNTHIADDEEPKEDSGPLPSGAGKTYSSFARLKPVVERVLDEHPVLIAGESKTANTVAILKTLHGNLGLGLKVIVRFLSRHPEIFQVDVDVLKNRIENLRALKLREGLLQRAISHTPQYLTTHESKISSVAKFLIYELDFTASELPELFLYSPQVFLNPPKETEEKFQYIYFAMGHKEHFALARHGVMRYSLNHIRTRHLFLERRGQFQLADKKRTVTIENPKIRRIVCSTDAYFCREVALCRLDELKLFKKVLENEDDLRENEEKEESHAIPQFADKLLKEMS